MGVFDGQPVNASVTNAAFLNKNQDDSDPNKVTLDRALSGPTIADLQQAVNNIYTATGVSEVASGTDYSATPNTINDGDPYLVALRKLADKFDAVTGHKHTGSAGDAPSITGSTIAGVPLMAFVEQTAPLPLSGGSTVVTTAFSGKSAITGSASAGVVTDQPYNELLIRGSDGGLFVDTQGKTVYGRLTFSAGVWTATFYSNHAGVETAYNFPAPATGKLFYQELFNPLQATSIYQQLEPARDINQSYITASTGQFGQVELASVAAAAVGAAGTIGTPNGVVANADHVHQGVHSVAATGQSQLFGDVVLIAGTNATLSQSGQTITFSASGSVSSVSLVMPSIFSVVGSPITDTGTFSVTLVAETGNTFFAGPATGGTGIPGFRSLVALDLAGLVVSSIAASGSSGITGAAVLVAGTNMTLSQVGQNITFNAAASGSAVNSIAASGSVALTGAVVLVAGVGMTLTEVGQNITFTPAASGTAVNTLAASGNAGLTGSVILQAGTNITLTQTGQTIKIDAVAASGSAVNSIAASGNAGLTGAVVLVAGSNIQLSQSGQNITIQTNAGTGGTFAQTTAGTGGTTATAPSGAFGFILMALDGNTDNLNWTVGSTVATPASGMQLEPGRDTGVVPVAATINLAAKTGTQTYAVQWLTQ